MSSLLFPPPCTIQISIITQSFLLISVISQDMRMTYETEISSLKVIILEEKAVRAEMARRHKAELEDLKKDIAEKVGEWDAYVT